MDQYTILREIQLGNNDRVTQKAFNRLDETKT